jgi:hypothetical protein
MQNKTIQIVAEWHADDEIWVATSEDVPGLVTEGKSVDEIAKKLPGMLCDLFELNGFDFNDQPPEIPFHLMASQFGHVTRPC